MARRDRTLPGADDLLDLYGSWKAVTEDVLDPRTPEGWDLDALYADYLAGTTQAEIAEQLGVTAEQVRLVFMRAGLPKRTRKEVNELLTERNLLRIEQETEQVRDVVLSAYRKIGLLKEVAVTTGVSYDLVRKVVSEAGILRPTQAWRVAAPNRSPLSARDATRILKSASKEAGGRLRVWDYKALALERTMSNGQPWPRSEMTLLRALGTRTWNEALEKAGVPVGRSTGTRSTSVEPCLRIIRQLTEQLGGPPSTREYDEVASSKGVILSQALEAQFGWRWGNVLKAAGVDCE